jgi:hypothetical protein
MEMGIEWIQASLPDEIARKVVSVDMLEVMLPTFNICGEIFMEKQLYKCPARVEMVASETECVGRDTDPNPTKTGVRF